MRIMCRQCHIELNKLNTSMYGFCSGCTEEQPLLAKTLDDQYMRLAQETSRRTWELVSRLAEDIHAIRTEVRMILNGERTAKKKKRKKVNVG